TVRSSMGRGGLRSCISMSPMLEVAAFQRENEYITNTRLIANGALMMWLKSEACGAKVTGCGVPITKPQARKATISTTFRMVATSWNALECFTAVSCTSATSQTTPTANAIGGASG